MGRNHPSSAALPEPMAVALLVAEELEALGAPYFIGGSLASAVHGVARATLDVDMVANLEERHVEPLVRALQSDFYVDEGAIHEAVCHRRSFNVIHLQTMFKVDVFVQQRTAYADEQFQRRVAEVVVASPRRVAYFASQEDIVLARLDGYRKGGGVSTRQWQDVLGVLRAKADTLDWDYMGDWAATLEIADLLDRARAEAGRP